MTNSPSDTKIVSLSTKITVIVFWGLIFVGLIFAAILFQSMEETTLDGRERLADNIAYKLHEALDYSGLEKNPELANQLYLIETRHPELQIDLHRSGKPVTATPLDSAAEQGHTITRLIHFTQVNGEKLSAELILRFPSLDDTLHSQRTPLLVGLGFLLLLFGSVIKGLLDNILNVPLRQMVATARAISEGKAETNLSFDATRNDEFGYVSRFINQAMEKMRESQELAWDAKELAEVTLQSIGDGVVTTDRKGRVVFMNPVAQQMLGITPQDAAGKPLWDIMLIVDEEQGREIANPITQCLHEHQSIELDDSYAILRSDDQKYPVEISLSPISGKGGAIHGAVIVLHDVREARALQRELSY
ncbi:MAG: PAS domain-containing protein, partial [Gammaproteobacteria bacterium]